MFLLQPPAHYLSLPPPCDVGGFYSKMAAIDDQAKKWMKQIEKLDWEICNAVLTENQKERKEQQIQELKDNIDNLQGQLQLIIVIWINRTQVGTPPQVLYGEVFVVQQMLILAEFGTRS